MIAAPTQKATIGLKLDSFEGPLDLLLRLIDEEKLAITDVAIAQVTEQYLKVLRDHEGSIDPEPLADFLVVAARLLYLKSKALFPSLAGVEDEGPMLADQLRVYQRFVAAAKGIETAAARRHVAFVRERLGGDIGVMFVPPRHLTADAMHGIMQGVIQGLQPLVRHSKEVIRRTISLRDTISRIQELLQLRHNSSFGELLQGATSRTEIIVTFLALLELVKQRTVVVQQEGMFGEMSVVKITNIQEVIISE